MKIEWHIGEYRHRTETFFYVVSESNGKAYLSLFYIRTLIVYKNIFLRHFTTFHRVNHYWMLMSVKEVVIFLIKLIRFRQYFISIFIAQWNLILSVESLCKLIQNNKIFVQMFALLSDKDLLYYSRSTILCCENRLPLKSQVA